jgi:hypothetical protein
MFTLGRLGLQPGHPRQGHGRLTARLCRDRVDDVGRHLRFHFHDQLEAPPDIGGLLREIDRDPIAVVWG